ncbi:MAG: NADH-quinone oxidoreductase subunit A [bacterium]
MSSLLAVITTFAVVGGLVMLILVLSSWLGPKRNNPVKEVPFECGWAPIAQPGDRHTIRFYLIAILFVLFDIEIVFLFPWAAVFRELGAPAFFSMLTFMAILILGLVYAWKRGALEWE